MSQMDGYPVEPNDKIWDKQDGHGTVRAVYGDNFTVVFGRRVRKVNYNGVMDQRKERTVFWAPNDFFIPAKNPAVYKKQRRAVQQIMGILNDLTGESLATQDGN